MEDRVRTLCQKLIDADDQSEEFRTIAAELQSALSEQIGRVRDRLTNYSLIRERRGTND